MNAKRSGNGALKIVQYQNHDARHHKLDEFAEALRTHDYEAMLILDLRHMTMVRIDGIPYERIAADVAANCPPELKRKYPYSLLRLAYEMYAGGLADEYDTLMEEIQTIIPTLPMPEHEKRHLKGEWLIISALPHTPNIRKVLGLYEQAAQLMQGLSAVLDAADPITFGAHGFLGVYLQKPGTAEELRPLILRMAALFSGFTGETLSGLDELYEASLAYYHGEIDDARRLTYKAIYLLEKTKQDALQISAGEQLAIIATHQGDVACFAEAVDYMNIAAECGANRAACRGIVELVRSGLLNALGGYQDTPEWLKTFSFASGEYGTGPFGDKNIAGNIHFAPICYAVACWYHALYLSQSGQYARALAVAEIMLQRIHESDGVLILELYFTLLAACVHAALGQMEKAQVLTERAVALACPDGLYLLLGDFIQHLGGMIESALMAHDKDALGIIRRVNDIYLLGSNALRTEYIDAELPPSLTQREHGVARLAAKGLHNNEIAKALDITESTVRAHLRAIFQKLDIDRRARLAEKLK